MSLGRARVIVKGLNFRSGPGTDHLSYGTLFLNDELDVLEDLDNWYKVSLSGREGYVSSSPSYVAFTRDPSAPPPPPKHEHTEAIDLVEVKTPYPTHHPVLLHPRAAEAFSKALTYPGLTPSDVQALCRINSSFRSWEEQEALIRKYEVAIGRSWISWNDLTEEQEKSARAAGFAYHPGNPPVDKPCTHVGGGALDIQSPLPPKAAEALEANEWKLDTKGDLVHWGWHG